MKKRDPNIVYPAGFEWIKAAIDVYGKDCPAKLLVAIGRPDGPRKIGGMERWRDACLAAGFDLERIRVRYRIRLKELREKFEKVCVKMPEIKKGKATRLDGKIVVTPELPEDWKEKAPKGASLICRVRPDDDATPGEWRYSELKNDGTFTVSALHFLKPKVGFQVGWKNGEWCKQPVFGQWIEETVD